MKMIAFLTIIENNLGAPIEYMFIFVVVLCSLLFAARNFSIGMMLGFLLNTLLFAWFYAWHQNDPTILYTPSLLVSLCFFVFMTLGLIASAYAPQNQGVV